MTLVETKSDKTTKKPSKVYINLDEDSDNPQDDEVIFVKKVTTPQSSKQKYFIKNNSHDIIEATQNPICLKLKKSNQGLSPKTNNKFVAPFGITKGIKKTTTPLPKWLQTLQNPKSTNLSLRNRNLGYNGSRSTLSEVFNLDEKKNYQELIRKVAESMNRGRYGKTVDIVNLAEDAASFRSTQRAQKQALDEIKLTEKGIRAGKECEIGTEYDPITVASLTSSDSEIEIIASETSSSSFKIGPVNTLRDSYRDKPITGNDWLLKLDNKYRKKKLEAQAKLKDAKLESDIISKVNSEQKIAQLEHKLKYELSIPESLFEEPQPVVELPPLTPEQEKLVSRALGPGPSSQVLVEKFNLRITR